MRSLLVVTLVALLTVVAIACSVETTRYANPDSLAKKSAAGPTASPLTDAGTTACADGGCDVTWGANVFVPIIVPKCGGPDCHSAGLPPKVTDGDPAATLAEFKAATVTIGTQSTPYVRPCDPQSAILCNLSSTKPCGSPMPKPKAGGAPLTDAELATLTKWISCGAPP